MAQISLNNLTECAMDVTDAFTKLREQILVYENGNEMEKSGGMNLINTTNLSFFNSSQKSELFRLKGKFSTHLGGRSKANQMFCRAIQVCPSYSNAWASWGELCSSIGYELEQKAKVEAMDEGRKESSIATAKRSGQYLAQGMGCYLEAVHWNTQELDGLILPKVLWMLSKEESPDGALCHTFDARTIGLPSWIWLPWLSQLLTCLCRVEGESVKDILSDIVASHPQSVYFMLRAFYLERRDIERTREPSSSGGTAGSSQQQHPQSPSVRHAEELMSTLRRAHPTLWSSLEVILEELIVRFRPSLEEELLATIAALKERVETQLEQQLLNGGKEVPSAVASFQKTLSRVSIKFFQSHAPDSEFKDDRSKKAAQFRQRYKSAFERDFCTAASSKDSKGDTDATDTKEVDVVSEEPLLLSELHKHLKKWNRTLERQISMAPSTFPLQQASPQLSFFSSDSPDLWPGTCDASYPGPKPSRKTGDNDDVSPTSSTSAEAGQAESIAGNAAQLVAAAAAREGMAGHAGGGTAVVEIPGQYAPYRATALDSKPRPELHTKLIRFHPVVETLRRKNQVNRRLGLVGNDGRTHKFLLQFAIPYWTRSDERAAQLNYVCSALMKKDPMAARKNLTMQPTAVTAIAQRLRMTADDTSNHSLEGLYADYCEQIGRDREEASNQCFEEAIRLLSVAQKGADSAGDGNKEAGDEEQKAEAEKKKQAEKKTLEKDVKLKAFQKVCQEYVESDVLLRSTRTCLGTPERSYHFRQAFARSIAFNSLMQYVFAVVDRSPERFVFNMRTGQMVSSDFRLGYSNQGFLEPAALPFRMSRNVQELLGPLLLQGLFVPSMGIIAGALHTRQDVLPSLLCLLLRDDIVHWYVSKSNARSDSKTRDLERQLMDRVQKNTSLAKRRLKECAPLDDGQLDTNEEGKGSSSKEQKNGLIDKRIRELLKTSMDPEKLCMMQNSYQPWL
jgi:transformation/transcription domain-associated protein